MSPHPPFIPPFNTGSIVLSSPPSPPFHPPFCHNPPYPLRDVAPPRAGAHPWKWGCVSLDYKITKAMADISSGTHRF